MVIYQKLLPRTKKRGVFYLSLKISSLNRLASYNEYPPERTLKLLVARHSSESPLLSLSATFSYGSNTYCTLNVSNIVLVIFKSFIAFCWENNLDKIKKSHIKSQSQYLGKKSQLDYFPKSFSPTYYPIGTLTP